MRATLALIALGVALIWTPAARAAVFTVTRLDDPVGAVCAGSVCDTLRAAVDAANKNAKDADAIQLDAATYTLQQAAQLTISSPLTITGVSARRTIVQGNGATRVLSVTSGPVTVQQLTIQGGKETTSGEFGGNVLKTASVLNLTRVRVTNGQAQAGGGVANLGGTLNITDSLIDDNTAVLAAAASGGGGIYNTVAPATTTAVPGVVNITNSTIAFNASLSPGGGRIASAHGGGIFNSADGSTTSLQGVTVARNTVTATISADGGGVWDPTATDVNIGAISSSGSIIASNVVNGAEQNCGGHVPRQLSASLEGTPASCTFSRAADPQLATALSDQGGYTDVLTIPASSPAKNLAANCPVLNDQRDAPRTAPCDAGAFEEGATAPIIDPVDTGPAPQPQPLPQVTPAPTPTATPTPPVPVFHKQVVVKPSGKVRVKLAGTNTFVDLASAADIPLGSTIDTKAGRIQLTSVPSKNGKPQTATFFGGIFKVTQPGAITNLELNESLASCAKAHSSAAKKKKPKTRHLWGNGSGSFRTQGKYSAATVRGTEWLVQDTCSGTLTRVKHGVVNVRDNVRHKTIVVRAGHRYLARPRH